MIIYNNSNDSLITFKINWSNFPDIKTEGNANNGTKVLCNLLPHKYSMNDHQIFAHGMDGCFVLCVSKTYGSTEQEIRQWFKDNDLTIIYQLENPIIKTVDLSVVDQDGNTIPKIKSYKDVTHLEITVPKQSLLPHISAEVATDNSKDMSSLTTKHQEISEAQSVIQDNIQSQSDEIDTALMATTEIFESILE